jgi:phosphinothricin acetyltransferase
VSGFGEAGGPGDEVGGRGDGLGGFVVRDATLEDAAACAAIYAPYVTDTAVSFEAVPPSAGEMAGRMAASLANHAWLVGEAGGEVVGYAYGGPFRTREAYRWSCETSVYLRVGLRRTGLGRLLYTELLDRLAARGYRRVIAGITLPNGASVGLHRAMGFEPAGVYRGVGFKQGRWHDVAQLQRSLGPHDEDAPPASLR